MGFVLTTQSLNVIKVLIYGDWCNSFVRRKYVYTRFLIILLFLKMKESMKFFYSKILSGIVINRHMRYNQKALTYCVIVFESRCRLRTECQDIQSHTRDDLRNVS